MAWNKVDILLFCMLFMHAQHARLVSGDEGGETQATNVQEKDEELLKGVVTFTEGRVAGSIALSLQNDAKDAEEKLWVMIYSKTGDEMGKVNISIAGVTNCANVDMSALKLLVANFTVPKTKPQQYSKQNNLLYKPKLFGDPSALGKAVVLSNANGKVECGVLSFEMSSQIKELEWIFPCGPNMKTGPIHVPNSDISPWPCLNGYQCL